ncbi:MAG: hypothetical protein ACOY46_09760 [Bacillota bacterium]
MSAKVALSSTKPREYRGLVLRRGYAMWIALYVINYIGFTFVRFMVNKARAIINPKNTAKPLLIYNTSFAIIYRKTLYPDKY